MAEKRFVEQALEQYGKTPYIKLGNLTKREVKIFLGGTCSGKDYRDELIPQLNMPYFNPVVQDWDEEAQRSEDYEKEHSAIHLYVITTDMQGSYSIAEIINSCHTKGVITVLYMQQSLRWKHWNGSDVRASIGAIKRLASSLGAKVMGSEKGLIEYLNGIEINKDVKNKIAPTVEFTIQSDPVSVVGVNGIQATDMLRYVKYLFSALDNKYSCDENRQTILKLIEAIQWQYERTNDRANRGVEGLNKK